MSEPGPIDAILAADAENAPKSQSALRDLFPEAMDAANAGYAMLEAYRDAWGALCDYDRHQQTISDWITQVGLRGDDALRMLPEAALVGTPPQHDAGGSAQSSYFNAVAVIARAYLSIRLARDYVFGLTDLLRLRTTSSVGYIRLQAESAGLMRLMVTDPVAAQKWFDSMVKGEGKTFYDHWQRRVKIAMRSLGIAEVYDQASGYAQHSRPWGVTRGILIGAKNKRPGRIDLVFQEEDEPVLLLFAFKRFLDLHRQLCDQALAIYPELDQAHLQMPAVVEFRRLTDELHAVSIRLHNSLGPGGVEGLLRKQSHEST